MAPSPLLAVEAITVSAPYRPAARGSTRATVAASLPGFLARGSWASARALSSFSSRGGILGSRVSGMPTVAGSARPSLNAKVSGGWTAGSTAATAARPSITGAGALAIGASLGPPTPSWRPTITPRAKTKQPTTERPKKRKKT